MAEWRLLALVAALASLGAAGCAAMPSSGAVHVGRVVPVAGGLGDLDVRVLPPAPVPGMSPVAIVNGFLHALVNEDGDYAVARSYLTNRGVRTWRFGAGVTTYDDTGLQVIAGPTRTTSASVTVRAPRIGRIDQRGDYTPSPGTLATVFTLVRDAGQWRIDRLPAGVMLSALDALRSFRLADVYYVNQSGTTLVPEQVLLPSQQSGATTALVHALLTGPGSWLAPAVATAAPPGTTLLGNVPVDPSGVAEVNLSGAARSASGAELQELSAQIVWTLRQVAEVTGVRLLVEGAPLAVPGVGARQPLSAWDDFAPSARPSYAHALFVTGRGLAVAGGPPLAGLPASSRRGDEGVALSPDARTLAVVTAADGGQSLRIGHVGQHLRTVLTATSITPPTFDPEGDVLVVVTDARGRRVVEVTQAGAVRTVPSEPALVAGPVQQLRLSRDGSRVAAVVGPVGAGELLVGRIAGSHAAFGVGAFRDVLPGFADVRGVAWAAADELVVTTASSGTREVVEVDVDGYASRTVPIDPALVPVDVAASPQAPLVITSRGAVWVDTSDGWRRVGPGGAPAYAD
jgi:Lipoprotein LpqB beta-propeller domain/Sporulation and spore germination